MEDIISPKSNFFTYVFKTPVQHIFGHEYEVIILQELSKYIEQLGKKKSCLFLKLIAESEKHTFSHVILQVLTFTWFTSRKFNEDAGYAGMRTVAFLGAGISGFLGFATVASADESEHGLAAPSYPWPHSGILSSYDHAS